MKNLVVIDFDGTLLPYESLRKLLWLLVTKYPVQMLPLLARRRLRIISSEEMKHKLVLLLDKKKGSAILLKQFAKKLLADCSKELLNKIQTWQSQNAEVLILSASPQIYLQYLHDALQCKVQGSYLNNNNDFVHLYGAKKANFLELNFPKSKYHYLYAVSDHKSDLPLLQLFESYDLIVAGTYA